MSNALLRIGRLDLPSIGQGDFAYIITTLGAWNFHMAGSAPQPASLRLDSSSTSPRQASVLEAPVVSV